MAKVKKEWPKLPKKFKAKWVAALRSGDYKQGTGALLTGEGKYCCLGVACKVANIADKHLHVGTIPVDYKGVPTSLLGDSLLSDLVGRLTGMNDTIGKTFKGIATWIEKNL